ncbi:hypothetical protein QR680_013714 [Steinernema hermaphroditum]|uniref:Uncharacterized protein n=1 Tax=Steinernema hermaphroditum TaxID=289476 RepID=A0AA39I6F5_9BILA|nr:hypothetical protein QR680_013714 [Steinernema hermaphroditum]
MSVQRGRPRIRDDDPSDPNRHNSEILRQRQRARLRREKEREQRARAARFAAESENLRRALYTVKQELASTRQELRVMTDAKERLEFERACDRFQMDELKKENEDMKWRLQDAAFYDQKVFHQM